MNGLMTEKSLTKDTNVLFNFSRTFVLKSTGKNVGLKGRDTIYKIVNDMWSISSPTVEQFENYRPAWVANKSEMNWKPNSVSEQRYFMSMLQQATDLKPTYCEE